MRINPNPYSFESYSVSVVKIEVARFYSVNCLFKEREDSLNRANNENQLSPGEQKGLARFLEDDIRWLTE